MFRTKFINQNLFNFWVIFPLLFTFFVSIPILSLIINFFLNTDAWASVFNYDIWNYIFNSLNIIFFQSIFVILLGVSTAWIITTYDFPLRNFFQFALLLPLSIPTYVAAIIYGDIFEYSSFFQTYLRDVLNYDFYFPDIRSLPGVIYIFSITLYPYVYILARAAFVEVSKNYSEVGITLGLSTFTIFKKIFLPLTSFAILGGVILSILESLNDFGTVQYFGVDTFTTAIYKTWIGIGEIETAAQLSIFFLFFIIFIIYLQRKFFSLERINVNKNILYKPTLVRTDKIKSLFLSIFCLIPFLLGFFIPLIFLIFNSFQSWDIILLKTTFTNSLNTIFIATIATFLIIIFSLLINYSSRIKNTKLNIFFKNFSSLGYAIPGSVIAIGVLIPFTFMDNILINFLKNNFSFHFAPLFSGSIFILIFAYMVRFFTISQINIESGFHRIPINIDNTAKVLGKKPFPTLFKVHIPIMSMSIILSSILIFIEILKELSATLILRPFNFNTLAIQVYEYSSDEKIMEASIPSLIIVVLCIIGIILITKINKILFPSEK